MSGKNSKFHSCHICVEERSPKSCLNSLKKSSDFMRNIGFSASRNAIRKSVSSGVAVSYLKNGEVAKCMPNLDQQ